MIAATYDTSGPNAGELRITELPDPEPMAGEVRVRLKVSGVNPTDWKARMRDDRPVHHPVQIPNQDGAGIVDAVGEGVSGQRVGERVWVYHAAAGRPSGTAAQYVCLPESQVVRLPGEVSLDPGAGLGIPGITAHGCLFGDGPIKGQTVLVTGGAGAVGHVAIQLARWAGARVIATVSTESKALLARQAGAHDVLGYRDPSFRNRLAALATDGIDRVVDVAVGTNLPMYLDTLAHRAVVVSYARDQPECAVPIHASMWRNITFRFVLVYGLPTSVLERATAELTNALRAGAIQPLPVQRFPLAQIEQAHAAVRAGVVGKVLVDIP